MKGDVMDDCYDDTNLIHIRSLIGSYTSSHYFNVGSKVLALYN